MKPVTSTLPASLRTIAFRLFLATSLVLLSPGCGSLSGPGSASFASVTIDHHSEADIVAATQKVFAADGYSGGGSGQGGQLVFEKEASRATSISRNGLVATHEGARALTRVKVDLVSLSDDSYRLQCQAYAVSGAGDSFFEDEVRLSNLRSGPYRSLLNKVKDTLKP